jgi:pimeloyl-ACP methyl ester carboxylesterase
MKFTSGALLCTALLSLTAEGQQMATGNSPAWSAAPTTSVIAVEQKFNNGPITLSGTLYLPVSAEKVPAVVAFHSSASDTRDLALYRHLKEMLPPLGVAVFVYDRRGSGRSGGTPAHGDYEVLADDGIAAERMLAKDPRIDARRIGFWGLSQGGWLSLLAASRFPDTAFVLSVSGPMTTPDVQMNFAVANILRIKGFPPSEIDTAIAARKAVDDFARAELDRATAQKRLDVALGRSWFDLIYLDRTLSDVSVSSWAQEIRHDPLEWLKRVRAPALILYGADDPWVPVNTSVQALRAQAAQHPNITVAIVAGADHDMSLSTSLEAQIDPAKLSDQAPDSPEYFALMASWLTAHGFAHR